MTAGELRSILSKFPDNTRVVVSRESDGETELFGIDGIDLHTGHPGRDSHGKAGFRVDRTGPTTWCFIEISPE
jgi:hypothetical protein